MDENNYGSAGPAPAPEPPGPQTATATAPPPPPPSIPGTATAAPPPGDGRRHRHGGGIGFGIVLVVAGGLLLAAQFAPGLAWWSLWPLILVLLGVVQAVTPDHDGWSINRFFDGLVTVAFGIVLLGCTTGYLPWSVWWQIVWLWPVLLIAAGVGLIGRAVGQRWLGAIGSALVIGALAWAALSSYQSGGTLPMLPSANAGRSLTLAKSEPVMGARAAALDLEVGAADVTLKSGTSLIAVDAESPFAQPAMDVARTGDSVSAKVSMETAGAVVWPSNPRSSLGLELSPDVVWTAKIASGATSMNLDFSDIALRGLKLSTGASDVKVRLGDPARTIDASDAVSGPSSVLVESGVSSIRVSIPTSAQVRLKLETALVGTNTGGLQKVSDGMYESPGFDSSKPYWDIVVKTGVGSVDIQRY